MGTCKNGHTAKRYANGKCAECRKNAAKRYRRGAAGKAAYIARYARTQDVTISKTKDRNARKTTRNRLFVIAEKSKPCMDCGGTFHPEVMDFDHRLGEEKRCGVSVLSQRHTTLNVLQSEIAKCDLVCANCHRMRTFRRRRLANDPLLM
jgi:hypothetical protein